jgi:hypothetical protein
MTTSGIRSVAIPALFGTVAADVARAAELIVVNI